MNLHAEGQKSVVAGPPNIVNYAITGDRRYMQNIGPPGTRPLRVWGVVNPKNIPVPQMHLPCQIWSL